MLSGDRGLQIVVVGAVFPAGDTDPCPSPRPQAMLSGDRGLQIVVVGAVFRSWPLLRDGLLEVAGPLLNAFQLLELRGSLCSGAAFLAARRSGHRLPRDCSKHTKLLCSWRQ